eukprot:TRINITY_DN2510_c0_g1_i2.p1 TRINITY_DN2510_c0_g1~~TRINITY_DN2510_c0_g1_i2.p1  ORF type:complete len:296 (+),score=72.77 TRINITY_DN2510_c0_g1_i2:50-937(+)
MAGTTAAAVAVAAVAETAAAAGAHDNASLERTPVASLLDALFVAKPPDKRAGWAAALAAEEYTEVGDLLRASAAARAALPLPAAIRDALRLALEDRGQLARLLAQGEQGDTRAVTQVDVVVFDVSGSMRATSCDRSLTRVELAKSLFHVMIDKLIGLEAAHVVGLTLFGDCITSKALTREFETFQDELGRAEANQGRTKLYDAIEQASANIIQYARENAARLDPACGFRIFCLTDGEDNASVQPYWRVAQLLQDNHIVLDALPVAGRNTKLEAMATVTGGSLPCGGKRGTGYRAV